MVAKLLTSTLCVGYNCLLRYIGNSPGMEVLNVLAVGPVGKSKQLPHRDPYLWIMPGVFMQEIGFYLAQHLNFCLKNLYPFTELLSRADGGLVSRKQWDHSSISAVASMKGCPITTFLLYLS